MVVLTGLPIGHSVMVALTGLPIKTLQLHINQVPEILMKKSRQTKYRQYQQFALLHNNTLVSSTSIKTVTIYKCLDCGI